MKVGGGLNFVTGPMGAGKTLYAVRRIVAAVTSDRHVVTNVELVDGWADRVARHVAPFSSREKRWRIAGKLQGLYHYETELAQAVRYRLPAGRQEGRGVFVWDEGHNDLNNRKWKDEGRDELLAWATQLRKLGFIGYLLTQHGDNTDAALRRICNFAIRLQNQREQTRVLGLRVSPWPLFLAWWYPAHLGVKNARVDAVRIERYFLGWHRHLYDTMGLFHGVALDAAAGNVIQLPDPATIPARALVPPEGVRARRSIVPGRKSLPALPGAPAGPQTLTGTLSPAPRVRPRIPAPPGPHAARQQPGRHPGDAQRAAPS